MKADQLEYYNGASRSMYNSKTNKYHRVRFLSGVPYVTFNSNTRVLYQGETPLCGKIFIKGKTEYLFGKP